MTDPVQTLTRQPLESPPEEIVLGAVRLFRYRAVATVASLLAIGAIVVTVLRAGPSEPTEGVVDDPRAVVHALDATGTIDGIEFRLTESTWLDGRGFIRVIVTELDSGRTEPEVLVEVGDVRLTFADVSGETTSTVVNQPSVTVGRTDAARTTASFWVEYESERPPADTLSIDFVVVPVPLDVVENGGVVSSEGATTGTITYERTS